MVPYSTPRFNPKNLIILVSSFRDHVPAPPEQSEYIVSSLERQRNSPVPDAERGSLSFDLLLRGARLTAAVSVTGREIQRVTIEVLEHFLSTQHFEFLQGSSMVAC
jgi:hypothetical protein